jgi:hypothetical protein
MSTLLTALVIVAALVLLVVRQLKPQRISDRGPRWLVMPALLVFFAFQQSGGVLDAHHHALSVVLLGVELMVGLAMGAGWAWTSRTWTEQDGSVWSRGTRATAAVWAGGIVLRLGLMGIGSLAGVHQSTGALLLALAVSVLVRGGLLQLRIARSGGTSSIGGSPYGGRMAEAQRKDRV